MALTQVAGGMIASGQTITSPTLTTPNIDSAQIPTVSGTAPLYMCRAWVNFNGTGTVAIRASGNVTSITDNNVGDYTINFTTAMSDANYGYALSGSQVGANWSNISPRDAGFAVGSLRIETFNGDATPAARDYDLVSVSIFR